jgi:hypothetical protein
MTLFKKAPPCPDPDLFVLVQGRNGSFWRRKRGSLKLAALNPILQQNSRAIAHCSPLAKRVAGKLAVFTRGMDTERLQPRLTAAFMKWLKTHEGVSLAALANFEFQPGRPLERLAAPVYRPVRNGLQAGIAIKPFPGCVQAMNKLATGYFFEAVLLYGDVNDPYGLLTEVQTSGYYPFEKNWRMQEAARILNGAAAPGYAPLQFMFDLPAEDTPYALLLRVCCLEGNELGANPMHYGMKVVGAG